MELKTLQDFKKHIYALRLWSVGPSGYDTPMEDFLPVYRDVLKSAVCDKLGLDVDVVIAEMIKNQEFYAYDMGDGSALLYTYYIVNDCRLWSSDAYWREDNEMEGGMNETVLTIDLNRTFNIEFEWGNLNPNDFNVIKYPSCTGGVSYCRYKCTEKTNIDNPAIYELQQMKTFKRHGIFRFPQFIMDGTSSWWHKVFTTEEECSNHVNNVFSESNIIKHKKAKLLDKHKEAAKLYESAKKAFADAEKILKSLKKEYFELTGEQI